MRNILLSLSVLSLLGACGGKETAEDTTAPAASDEPAAAEVEEGPGRDLSAVDVCALIPADAVAGAAGSTPEGAATPTEPGFDGKGCRYEYRVGGLRQSTEVSLHPPGTCNFWRDMQSFKLTDLSGIGDRAFWGQRTGQTDFYVLKSGDVCVHVQARGQELEQAQAIAEAVLGRL